MLAGWQAVCCVCVCCMNFAADALVGRGQLRRLLLASTTFIRLSSCRLCPPQRQEDGHNRLKRVILIGDHHQLPPVVKNMAIQQYRCRGGGCRVRQEAQAGPLVCARLPCFRAGQDLLASSTHCPSASYFSHHSHSLVIPPCLPRPAPIPCSHLDQSLFTRFIRLGTPYIELNAQVGHAACSSSMLLLLPHRHCLPMLAVVPSQRHPAALRAYTFWVPPAAGPRPPIAGQAVQLAVPRAGRPAQRAGAARVPHRQPR